jgi:hypothetical protein
MQAGILMGVYVVTTIVVQLVGFLISQMVSYQWPAAGLMTFLVLFMAAFGLAWPIAVRIAEWGLRHFGFTVETEESGGETSRRALRGMK